MWLAPISNLQVVLHFALTQSLIEALTECEVALLLCALYELFYLPGARTGWLLTLVVAGCWRSCLLLLCRLTAPTAKHTS